MEEVFSDPQVLHRKMLEVVDHPTIGKLKLAGIPAKYSDSDLRVRRPPPLLGEHTDEVLENFLGISKPDIARLKDTGVL
jgi:crotonobetainyl-CoA:carnitine CoA-transferase CaiB-like acyl-CoA transferase